MTWVPRRQRRPRSQGAVGLAGSSHEADSLSCVRAALPPPSLRDAACLPAPIQALFPPSCPLLQHPGVSQLPLAAGPRGALCPNPHVFSALLGGRSRGRGLTRDGWMQREPSAQPLAGEASGAPVCPGCMRWGAALLPASVRSPGGLGLPPPLEKERRAGREAGVALTLPSDSPAARAAAGLLVRPASPCPGQPRSCQE